MKKIISVIILLLFISCSTSKSKSTNSQLYQILLSEDYGGASFQFYEIVSEAKEFRMLLGDDKIKKFVKPDDITTSNFILVNLGQKDSEGYKAEITSVVELRDKVIVTIKEIEPTNKIEIQDETPTPYCIVKINSKKIIEIK